MPRPPRPSRPVAHPSSLARTGEPLLWLSGGGHQARLGRGYSWDSRARVDPPHVVLQLTLDGCGFYERAGRPRVSLPAGTAFMDFIPGPFSYGWAAGSYELAYLCLQGPEAVRWMRHVHAQHGPVFSLAADPALGRALLELAVASSHRDAVDRYAMSARLYALLMGILSALSRSRMEATPLAERAMALLASRAPDAGFDVAQLARALGCSREHLTREFRRASHLSPIQFLTQQRVRLAARMLRDTGEKLEALAPQCGFASAAYLCRVFRRTVSVTPHQFRQRPWLLPP